MRDLNIVAALAVCVLAAGCGKPAEQAGAPAATPVSAPAPGPTDAEKQAALAALPAPYNTGDLINGKRSFALCRSCHTITEGGPNMTGPNLYGVFGRQAGSKADYTYSPALKAAGFSWDAAHLDSWLSNPRTYLPGTKMSFAGLHDPKDRVDLIAYLKVESGYKPGG